MTLEVDQRNLEEAAEAATAEALELEATLLSSIGELTSATIERSNTYTGTPAVVTCSGWPPDGAFVEKALELATSLSRVVAESPDFIPDPQIQETSSGERIVHLHQHVHGIPVFQGARVVRFGRNGEVDVLGDHVPLRRAEVNLIPELDASGAVLAAARHLAASGGIHDLEVSSRRPRLVAAFPLPATPCVLRKPPFPGLINVHLIFFYRRPEARLGWYVPLRLPDRMGQYDLIVAATGDDAGEILFCRDVVPTATGEARACRFNPEEEPLSLLAMPQPLSAYPPFRPARLPSGDWIGRDRTEGNNAKCQRSGRTVRGTVSGGRVSFRSTPGSDDELVVNAFFLCNFLHDFFYLLGFAEQAGNFQRINPPGMGLGTDELELEIFGTAFQGDANIQLEVDGRNLRLNLGPILSPAGTRHTALDADVVIHEFVHGVTDRLVGGPAVRKVLVLGPPQARALDEGTSDYFALTIQNYLRQGMGRPERLVYGAWSSGNPATGRRRQSYAGFNHPFSRLGSPGFINPHDAGMIWCAALLEMNRRLGSVLGSPLRGHEAGWQILVNALKSLTVGQGTLGFLAVRDAILRALNAMSGAIPVMQFGPLFSPGQHSALMDAARHAFASLGMGRNARSPNGTFAGLQDDFNP